nr:MAG TPA: hypothetical protein [Caudoviricetes sp.]
MGLIVKLTPSGFYESPRVIKGEYFLAYIKEILDCGDELFVQFGPSQDPSKVLSYTRLYDSQTPNAVFLEIEGSLYSWTIIEDIAEFEFVQYRPKTAWKVIHMGSSKRINVSDFDELYINQTFRKMTPVIFLHEGRFWHVMGLELAASNEAEWFIYLKRQESDFMTRVPFTRDQKFIFNPLSNSWSLDDPTQEIKDLETIKKALKSEDVSEVVVSGVYMRLVRVQEIVKGVLFFVFLDTSEARRYYYARRTTKLRIVTDSETGEQKYLLDHIKAMHID